MTHSDANDQQSRESGSANKVQEEDRRNNAENDIDPANEVKGVKLYVIHTGICLCTFLIGLVGSFHVKEKTISTETYYEEGLQSHRNGSPGYHYAVWLHSRCRLVWLCILHCAVSIINESRASSRLADS